MPIPIELWETEIPAVLEVHGRVFHDERGYFTEVYNQVMWAEQGQDITFLQDNLSLSCKGTLRGMHYQIEPRGMGKLVRALRGRVYDVAVDLRKGSPTFGKWVGRELSAANNLALWIPAGFGHGFLALEDESLVLYKCDETHAPSHERAFNYADPEVGIAWPEPPTVVSGKDADAPPLKDAEYNFTYNPL